MLSGCYTHLQSHLQNALEYLARLGINASSVLWIKQKCKTRVSLGIGFLA